MSSYMKKIFLKKNGLTICSGDPGQMPHSMASDLGLHCLPVTHLGVQSSMGLIKALNLGKKNIKKHSMMFNHCGL